MIPEDRQTIVTNLTTIRRFLLHDEVLTREHLDALVDLLNCMEGYLLNAQEPMVIFVRRVTMWERLLWRMGWLINRLSK